jgi:hypothetical protein
MSWARLGYIGLGCVQLGIVSDGWVEWGYFG